MLYVFVFVLFSPVLPVQLHAGADRLQRVPAHQLHLQGALHAARSGGGECYVLRPLQRCVLALR